MNNPPTPLTLQPSETAVLHAASRILAACISAGQATPDNEKEQIAHAVRVAVEMAKLVDRSVKSDGEMA